MPLGKKNIFEKIILDIENHFQCQIKETDKMTKYKYFL